jgi:hypothetical protein
MSIPRATGVSGITENIVTIRHASDADIVNVGEELGGRMVDTVDLSHADIVVALEEERMIGFGILEYEGMPEGAGCLSLREKDDRRGIGLSIVRHLFEYADEVRQVTAPSETARYLADVGFRRRKNGGLRGGESASSSCGAEAKDLIDYERAA